MSRIIFVFAILTKVFCFAEYQYRLSICAIFQDEAPYLKEWIEYHQLIGIEHFYLFNHLSQDNFKEVLNPYIASGLVQLENKPITVKDVKAFTALQAQCYNECLRKESGISKWIAFIDIDEFIVPVRESNLVDLVERYNKFGGIAVNWRTFGTSNIKKIPNDKLMVECLTACCPKSSPINQSVKVIVRPERITYFQNAHQPILLDGYSLVNTDKIPFEGPIPNSYIQTNQLQINHYWTRDESFFYQKKIPRQKKWGAKPDPDKILFHLNAEKDTTIFRFIPELRKNSI